MARELKGLGFADCFRELNPLERCYSWWPYAFNARERNLGWRIDYIYVNQTMLCNVKTCRYLNEFYGSDHCPLFAEISFDGE